MNAFLWAQLTLRPMVSLNVTLLLLLCDVVVVKGCRHPRERQQPSKRLFLKKNPFKKAPRDLVTPLRVRDTVTSIAFFFFLLKGDFFSSSKSFTHTQYNFSTEFFGEFVL